MGDVADTSHVVPYPQDIVSGVGESEPKAEETEVENETVIENENTENGDENIGKNIDVTD